MGHKNKATGLKYADPEPGEDKLSIKRIGELHYRYGEGVDIRKAVTNLYPGFFDCLEESIGANKKQQVEFVLKNMKEWVGRWVVMKNRDGYENGTEGRVVTADEWKAKLKWGDEDKTWKERFALGEKRWREIDGDKFNALGIKSNAFEHLFGIGASPSSGEITKKYGYAMVCGFIRGIEDLEEERFHRFLRALFNNTDEEFDISKYLGNLRTDETTGSDTESRKVPPKADQNEMPPKVTGGENKIFYGVPGCGKSHAIEGKIDAICRSLLGYNGLNADNITRVVFHPDYTYYDFTGQLLPVKAESGVEYDFKPGPFTNILKKAIKNEFAPYFLIIEEINRGNAAAIFGDLFQLLDRSRKEAGKSKYEVDNHEIAKIVYRDTGDKYKNIGDKIFIPANLWLLATMNTSDQNVFTLDTAFQRRWSMELIPNKFDEKKHNFLIEGTEVTWMEFASKVNEKLEDGNEMMSGDKRLGAWFVKADKTIDGKKVISKECFANKVLKYLWDDAFKFNRGDFFNTAVYKTLEKVIEKIKAGQGINDLFTISFGSTEAKKTEEAGAANG
jgi:hypothetical protein